MSASVTSKQHQHGHHVLTPIQKLALVNEQTWLTIGSLAEMMMDDDKALYSYESALKHNPYSIPALSQIATLFQKREQFKNAIHYYKRIVGIQENHGETWTALGHCHLMMDQLQEAYGAYQQALYHLNNPKDPKLWYGIGILYDRYNSLDHAEEAFSAILKMDPDYEKKLEVYFRLGVIYKRQEKYDLALQCFHYLLEHQVKPPVTEADVWRHIGLAYDQQKLYAQAKEAYENGLKKSPHHAQLLQQLGWLYHHENNTSAAIQYLLESIKVDDSDAQSWYLLGRCYMTEKNFNKAYEAYQHAVDGDAKNPTFWCSIGVLYFQINQYRDALDAYSKAIRLNPHMSEVWYDLGTLYESCQNQVQDALDAYQRAAELDPNNPHIKQRLELLRRRSTGAGIAGDAPLPRDVMNPSQYNTNHGSHGLDQPHRQNSNKQQEVTYGRDLPGLGAGASSEKYQRIPDITNTATSSPSSRMNSMIINEEERKEPRSPHPTFAPPNAKEYPVIIKDEDEIMKD